MNYGRGSMMHLILTLCRRLEEAFGRIVDGKKDGKFCFYKSSSGVVYGVGIGVFLVTVDWAYRGVKGCTGLMRHAHVPTLPVPIRR